MKQKLIKRDITELEEARTVFLLGMPVHIEYVEYEGDGSQEVDRVSAFGPLRAFLKERDQYVVVLHDNYELRWSKSEPVTVTISWLEPLELRPEFV